MPLSEDERRARRDAARAAHAEAVRRRRAAALGVLGAVVVAGVVVLGSGSDDAPETREAQAAQATPTPKPKELPTGGRRIFPDYRVVGYYGAPQAAELGILGIGKPETAVKRLRKQAKPYARKTRPTLLALELISTIVTAAPGETGLYRSHQPDNIIRRYLKAARKAKALLVLDIQPGRDDFFTETKRLKKYLKEPDVGLALDPEWRMGPNEIPGKVIGSVEAREVNATSAWLAQLVKENNLPEKLFIVHQFTDGMIENKASVKPREGLAMVFNVDGFGNPANKLSKWDIFTKQRPHLNDGYKLFYKEDVNLMSPKQVMRMKPRPDLVMYE
jgi:hypothetical protein